MKSKRSFSWGLLTSMLVLGFQNCAPASQNLAGAMDLSSRTMSTKDVDAQQPVSPPLPPGEPLKESADVLFPRRDFQVTELIHKPVCNAPPGAVCKLAPESRDPVNGSVRIEFIYENLFVVRYSGRAILGLIRNYGWENSTSTAIRVEKIVLPSHKAIGPNDDLQKLSTPRHPTFDEIEAVNRLFAARHLVYGDRPKALPVGDIDDPRVQQPRQPSSNLAMAPRQPGTPPKLSPPPYGYGRHTLTDDQGKGIAISEMLRVY